MIPTFIHGILDYAWCALLIAAPWLFGFNSTGIETYVTDTAAAIVLTYSAFTKYELSLSKNIPVRTHLGFDFAAGALLAASPWIFGFADMIYLPHLTFGIFSMVISLLTEKRSPVEKNDAPGSSSRMHALKKRTL